MTTEHIVPTPNPASTTNRDLIQTSVQLAFQTAWWATGPIRSAGRRALRGAESALSDTHSSTWLHSPPRTSASQPESIGYLIQSLVRPLLTRIVDAALAEVDLTEVILHNVDLDAVAAHLNVDAIIKTVDINSIVATVDLNAAIHRVDVNAIVKRIDLNGAVAMVDLNTIVNRLDINEIADEHRPWPVARRPSRDPPAVDHRRRTQGVEA